MRDFSDEWSDFVEFHSNLASQYPGKWFCYVVRQYRWYHRYWLLAILNHMLEVNMARGKKQPEARGRSDNKNWTTFVEISLAGYTEQELDDAYRSPEELYDKLAVMLEAGYRVAVSYNAQNDAFIASVSCRDDSSVNAGCTFTALAGDWVSALRMAVFKHFDVAKEEWGAQNPAASRPRYG